MRRLFPPIFATPWCTCTWDRSFLMEVIARRDDNSWAEPVYEVQEPPLDAQDVPSPDHIVTATCRACKEAGLSPKSVLYHTPRDKSNAWRHVKAKHPELKPTGWGTSTFPKSVRAQCKRAGQFPLCSSRHCFPTIFALLECWITSTTKHIAHILTLEVPIAWLIHPLHL